MTINRSQLTFTVQEKLNKIDLPLPKSTEIKYLPLTNQLMIYSESKDFNREIAKKIGTILGDHEVDAVKTGMWRWTNLVLIDNFIGTVTTNDQENLQIALKTLITYAVQKEKDRQSSDLSWAMHEAHFEGTDEEVKMISKELDKVMFSDSKKIVSNTRLIDTIQDLKKEKKDQQRYQLHTTLSVLNGLDFENKVTPGCVELLLKLLPQIDEQKLDYEYLRNLPFTYPKDIKISYYKSQTSSHDLTARSSDIDTASFIYTNKNHSTHFQSISNKDNLLKIAGLELTVSEFNEKFKDQYAISKANEIVFPKLWLIHDKDNKKCAELMVEGNEIKETPFSKRTHNYINTINETVSKVDKRKPGFA